MNFDYDTNELTFEYSIKNNSNKKIVFSKKEDEVFIVRSDDSNAYSIFSNVSNIISEAYDEMLNFKYSKEIFSNYTIDIINSSLKASVSNSFVGLYRRPRGYFQDKDFEISFGVLFNSRHVDCNSSLVLELLKNNEEKLLQNVFIKINECPEWMRSILYQTRKENLEKELKLAEEQLKKEIKLQRRKRIINFLNPFSK